MSAGLVLAVAAGGGVGAMLRFVLDGLLKSTWGSRMPWATGFINLSGSFVLGLLTGLATAHALPGTWLSVLGTGVLGGYTTFSTAMVETVRLAQDRRWAAAAANGAGVLVLGVLLALAGLAAGRALG